MDTKSDSTEVIPQLRELADFRFLLRSFLSFSEAASESLGIAAQHYQLLQVIGAAPAGQATSVSYLAERMFLRHNSMVELVDRAERAGLVVRRSDREDLRRSLIDMTPRGRSVMEQLVALHLNELRTRADAMIEALRAVQAGKPKPSAVLAPEGTAAR